LAGSALPEVRMTEQVEVVRVPRAALRHTAHRRAL
jgi:hypothetical protein